MATRIIQTARWIPDPKVTEIDRGNGLHELMVSDTLTVKQLEAFEFQPKNRKRISKEERENIKRHNRRIILIAGLPSALCVLTSTLQLALNDSTFMGFAIASYTVTAFVVGVNLLSPRKEKK